MFLPGWAITQIVKPAGTFLYQHIGFSAALDENIIAVGGLPTLPQFKQVYAFDISINPAQQLTVLSSDRSSLLFGTAVAVSRKHGILVGAPYDDVGSMFEAEFSFSLDNRRDVLFMDGISNQIILNIESNWESAAPEKKATGST